MFNDPVQIVFWFDTTGSMYPCLNQVRKNVSNVLASLFKEMPRLEIGIGANGDYCDAGRTYITTHKDFTTKLDELVHFAQTVSATGGGDYEECYELVLNEVKGMSWRPDAKKILVLMADAEPHPVHDFQNKRKLDWRYEAQDLANKGIQIYSVQCLPRDRAAYFYSDMARITNGYHLKLDQFSEILEIIKAVTYRQQGVDRVEKWEQEVTHQNRMTRALEGIYLTLTDKKTDDSRYKDYGTYVPGPLVITTLPVKSAKAVPVELGRFQVLSVDTDYVIKDFVEDNGLIFKTGRGFYEFTKAEDVQEKKEVVVRDKKTGDMFSGDKARYIIGVAPGTRGHVRPHDRDKYDIFIQSTSFNRKLKKGTKFLYEVDMSR